MRWSGRIYSAGTSDYSVTVSPGGCALSIRLFRLPGGRCKKTICHCRCHKLRMTRAKKSKSLICPTRHPKHWVTSEVHSRWPHTDGLRWTQSVCQASVTMATNRRIGANTFGREMILMRSVFNNVLSGDSESNPSTTCISAEHCQDLFDFLLPACLPGTKCLQLDTSRLDALKKNHDCCVKRGSSKWPAETLSFSRFLLFYATIKGQK